MLPNEPLILVARRAFPDAQAALDGATVERPPFFYSLSWYGTALSDDIGSFGLVNQGGPLADRVGDILRVRHRDRSALAYIVGATPLDSDLVVTRRVYAALALLSTEEIGVLVEVVE